MNSTACRMKEPQPISLQEHVGAASDGLQDRRGRAEGSPPSPERTKMRHRIEIQGKFYVFVFPALGHRSSNIVSTLELSSPHKSFAPLQPSAPLNSARLPTPCTVSDSDWYSLLGIAINSVSQYSIHYNDGFCRETSEGSQNCVYREASEEGIQNTPSPPTNRCP
ncbi:hypothetical protein CEXT_89971 [Caerostris extrusa]|uniref:Uncharacterized protein n=1 Tax=Caerostris extrusa TaxID=172846 RepID=A0AAV4WTR6_CAEEX|nr:hypothetical protein CEXT_89971 [Caerostris extrusa]